MALSPKKRTFVTEYLKNGFNAEKAYIAAGYTPCNGNAWRLRRDPEVAAYITECLDNEALTAPEVLAGLRRIATATVRDFFSVQGTQPVLDMSAAFENGAIDHAKKIIKNRGGTVIEMYDKLAALNSLAKAHGLHDRAMVEELIKAQTGAQEITDELVLDYAQQIIARRASQAQSEGRAGMEQDPAESDPANGSLDSD